jgi:hypothetical protein
VRTVGFSRWAEGLETRALLSALTVTNNADHGSGSLRAVIGGAASGDVNNFSASLAGRSGRMQASARSPEAS